MLLLSEIFVRPRMRLHSWKTMNPSYARSAVAFRPLAVTVIGLMQLSVIGMLSGVSKSLLLLSIGMSRINSVWSRLELFLIWMWTWNVTILVKLTTFLGWRWSRCYYSGFSSFRLHVTHQFKAERLIPGCNCQSMSTSWVGQRVTVYYWGWSLLPIFSHKHFDGLFCVQSYREARRWQFSDPLF